MVFHLCLALVLFLSAAAASAQGVRWVRVNSGTTNSLASIHFASPSEAWIAGDSATVLRSSDGGATWRPYTQVTSDPAKCCFAVRFVSPTVGWVGGSRVVSKITSGAANTITYNVLTELRYDLFSVSTSVAWVAGAEETSPGSTRLILYRIEPGRIPSQFKIIFLGSSGSYRSIHLIDENNGIAVGTGGRITRISNASSNNPGTSNPSSGTSADLHGVFMLNATNAWAIGSAGTILRNDGSFQWTRQFAPTTNRLNDVYFKDASNGVIVGNAGLILATSNGGASWTIEPSGVPDDLRGVYFAANAVWAVGANGTILKRVVSPPRRRTVRR